LKALLFDPQTAGGLLISVASPRCRALVDELQKRGVKSTEIGDVLEDQRYGSAKILIV
jgi:selenophosphate synthase